MVNWSSILTLVNAPVYFLVAWILYRRNLWRSYLFFWIYLLVEGAAMVANITFGGARRSQLLIYEIAQPPIWILYVLMVAEVFRKVFARFPGISRFSQRLVIVSMLIAFVFALASIGADFNHGWGGASVLQRYSAIQRAITSALSIYLILIAGFLVWMPIPLPRNTIRHSFLFFFYFLITTGVHYYINLLNSREFIQSANVILTLLTLIALLSWMFLLQANGEDLPLSTRPAPRAASGDILGRLESLNQSLSRPKE